MAGLRLMTAADPLEEFNEIQGENMTGNHYRNHFIKVPTAPGEPCRGWRGNTATGRPGERAGRKQDSPRPQ